MRKLIPLLLCCVILCSCVSLSVPPEPIPTETAEVQVEEVNMNVLVEQLIAYGVLPENVHIGSMQLDGTCLRLNFSSSFADHANTMGSSGEMILFGSIVNTFLSAWPEAETVFITAGGQIIETGHVVYDFEMSFRD